MMRRPVQNRPYLDILNAPVQKQAIGIVDMAGDTGRDYGRPAHNRAESIEGASKGLRWGTEGASKGLHSVESRESHAVVTAESRVTCVTLAPLLQRDYTVTQG